MSDYLAPIQDMRFTMDALADFARIQTLPGCEEVNAELADAVLEEAAKLSGEILSPLNRVGDKKGCVRQEDGDVLTPAGWKEAYHAFCAGGWNGIASPAEWGGQDLPHSLAVAVKEMVCSANMAFSLAPLLTTGACAALELAASPALQALYLPRMISGEWTGSMNLTEPQAGSDLALLRTRAEPHADGSYRLFGQKIFITYGEHDLSENIVHLVLARLPDAPPGVRGISLFVVPKFLLNPDGSLGERNDVRCVSLEHKLGIHASPTAVLAFGDAGGAIGQLVGQAHHGLEYMFIMMNEARLGVALQGVAIAERARQQAHSYARERTQGRDAVSGQALAPIIQHPDVQRMLMLMQAQTQAGRALVYWVSSLMDDARRHPDADTRQQARQLVDFMIPIAKGWCTEMGIEVASLGIQIHGGMGYIEETGAAQHLRDARIATIYEGTTGIQANDLLLRKLLRDGGASALLLQARMQATLAELLAHPHPDLNPLGIRLSAALEAWINANALLMRQTPAQMADTLAAATPYLMLSGIVCAGWMMGRAALAAVAQISTGQGDERFLRSRIASARFFAEQRLPHALAEAHTIQAGACGLLDGLQLN